MKYLIVSTICMMCMYMCRMLYSQANKGLGCMAYCPAPVYD